jgi:hypothetical protein
MGRMFFVLAQLEDPARFSSEWWLTVGVTLGVIFLVALIVNPIARRYVRRLERASSCRGDRATAWQAQAQGDGRQPAAEHVPDRRLERGDPDDPLRSA